MTDWAASFGGAAWSRASAALAPVLRRLGCDPPPATHGPAGPKEGTFIIGSRLGRPARGLLASDGSTTVLFDGRLDNRVEIARSLGQETRGRHDPALVLALWRRDGEAAFAALRGPFAVAVWQGTRQRLVLARDVLGDQALSYHRPRDCNSPFLLAPDAGALLAAPEVRAEANERSLARLLALRAPLPGETYFADVEEVPPGHLVTWTPENGLDRRRFAALEPDASARIERDPVGKLRELLTGAVSSCLDGADGPSAILLSGGLDSSAIAARASAVTTEGRRPVAISWIFEQLPAGDDAAGIGEFARSLGIRWEPLVSDDLWPLGGTGSPVACGSPLGDIYHRLQDAAFTRAHALDLKVVLCGYFGDHLWIDGGWWFRDLLARGRLDLAAAALLRQWDLERRNAPRRGTARGAVAKLLGRRASIDARPPEWLTPEGIDLAALESTDVAPPSGVRPEQWNLVADPLAAHGIHATRLNAARWGLEMCYPYRNSFLIEWMLGLGADQLYSPGSTKVLLRRMLRADGFDGVAARQSSSTLLPLAARGLVAQEGGRVQSLLRDPEAEWPRYVQRDWLRARFPDPLAAGADGAAALVGWFCLCTEHWRRGLDARAVAA
jgi:hypothetical protein